MYLQFASFAGFAKWFLSCTDFPFKVHVLVNSISHCICLRALVCTFYLIMRLHSLAVLNILWEALKLQWASFPLLIKNKGLSTVSSLLHTSAWQRAPPSPWLGNRLAHEERAHISIVAEAAPLTLIWFLMIWVDLSDSWSAHLWHDVSSIVERIESFQFISLTCFWIVGGSWRSRAEPGGTCHELNQWPSSCRWKRSVAN